MIYIYTRTIQWVTDYLTLLRDLKMSIGHPDKMVQVGTKVGTFVYSYQKFHGVGCTWRGVPLSHPLMVSPQDPELLGTLET